MINFRLFKIDLKKTEILPFLKKDSLCCFIRLELRQRNLETISNRTNSSSSSKNNSNNVIRKTAVFPTCPPPSVLTSSPISYALQEEAIRCLARAEATDIRAELSAEKKSSSSSSSSSSEEEEGKKPGNRMGIFFVEMFWVFCEYLPSVYCMLLPSSPSPSSSSSSSCFRLLFFCSCVVFHMYT